MTYISDSLVPIGTKRAAISIAELEKTLRMQYDQIAWITCDVEGTRLVVRFVETVEKEEVTTFDTPCNIVAVKDGIVLDLLAKSGTKLVNPGDEVKKGDVLITGVVNIYNEYEELIETNYVAADGIVYAQTKYQYQQAFPLDYTQKRQGKKKKTGITIQLGIRPGHLGGRTLSLSNGLSGTVRCKGRLLVRRKRRAHEKGHPAAADGISEPDRPLFPRFRPWRDHQSSGTAKKQSLPLCLPCLTKMYF